MIYKYSIFSKIIFMLYENYFEFDGTELINLNINRDVFLMNNMLILKYSVKKLLIG